MITPALLLGLTACNNDVDNDTVGMRNGNGVGNQTVRYDLNHVNYRGTEYDRVSSQNRFNYGYRNVNFNNNNNDFMDNRGVLTEDYTDSKFNKDRNRLNTNVRNRNLNNGSTRFNTDVRNRNITDTTINNGMDRINGNVRNRNTNLTNDTDRINTNIRNRTNNLNNDMDRLKTDVRNRDFDLMNTRASKNNNDNISSLKTNKTSATYPHTKAILIQDAKYRFVPINDYDNRKNLAVQQRQFRHSLPTPGNLGANQQQNIAQQQAPAAPTAPTNPTNQTKTNQQQAATGDISQLAQQVIDLTNAQRKQNGLPALQTDAKLSSVAQTKSDDMQKNGYFSHTSPTYGSPFDMMRDFGVTYRTAGENIAQGQRSAQEVVNAWMNSEGHRKNILSKDFTHIGVGYDATGKHWVQMFVGR